MPPEERDVISAISTVHPDVVMIELDEEIWMFAQKAFERFEWKRTELC